MRDAITKAVERALRHYRLSNMAEADDESCGYPLVDMLSPKGAKDISSGEEEIGRLAEHISDALSALQEQPAPEWNAAIEAAALAIDCNCNETCIHGRNACPKQNASRILELRKPLSALQPSPAREEAEALKIPDAASIAYHLWEEDIVEEMLFARKISDAVHAFIARHHLGEKS
jgi:hypothetical protein